MRLFFVLCGLLFSATAFAQQDRLSDALRLQNTGDPKGAVRIIDSLYQSAPANSEYYTAYFRLLLQTKDFKGAEKLAEARRSREPGSPLPFVDMGVVMQQSGKEKKAEEIWNEALRFVNGDDLLTNNLATAFSAAGQDAWALKVYEKASDIVQNKVIYAPAMARLYAKTGNTEAAIDATLNSSPMQLRPAEDIKAALLEILGDDVRKTQIATKTVIKRVQADPGNILYADILLWLYTRRDDWEGALLQVRALDERGQEGGRRLLEFARTARAEGQYDIAYEALGMATEAGTPAMQNYAAAERLHTGMQRLQGQPIPDRAFADTLAGEFDRYFVQHPQDAQPGTTQARAALEARFRGNVSKAVSILQESLTANRLPRLEAGAARLDLGDYQLLEGKVWDATLTYSQVDKAFREDALGEEARFRNAKLAWYRGDFDWAQGQLSVLKASTSELIANDALALSVLITENTPPDSNYVPLRRFAAADLLLFQNRLEAASTLLDSVAKGFPESELQDDILFKRSAILVRQQRYDEAIALLEKIVKDYGADVLSDDALYQQGIIYEVYLKKPQQARAAFERLLIDYPGSTLAAEARKRLLTLAAPSGT